MLNRKSIVADDGRDFDCLPDGTPRHDSLYNVKVAWQRLGIARGQRVDAQSTFRKIARRFGFLPLPHIRRDALRWLRDVPMEERKKAKRVAAALKIDDGREFRRHPDGGIDRRYAGNFHLAVMRLGIVSSSVGDAADVLDRVERRFGFVPSRYSQRQVFAWLNLQKPPAATDAKRGGR